MKAVRGNHNNRDTRRSLGFRAYGFVGVRAILYGFPSSSQLPAGSSGSGRNGIFSFHTERGPSSCLPRIWAFDWLEGFHFSKENFRNFRAAVSMKVSMKERVPYDFA